MCLLKLSSLFGTEQLALDHVWPTAAPSITSDRVETLQEGDADSVGLGSA
jgi:hypothetical protein